MFVALRLCAVCLVLPRAVVRLCAPATLSPREEGATVLVEALFGSERSARAFARQDMSTNDLAATFDLREGSTRFKEMTYGEFYSMLKNETYYGSYVLKDDRKDTELQAKILKEILMPEFYHEVAELEGIELI